MLKANKTRSRLLATLYCYNRIVNPHLTSVWCAGLATLLDLPVSRQMYNHCVGRKRVKVGPALFLFVGHGTIWEALLDEYHQVS